MCVLLFRFPLPLYPRVPSLWKPVQGVYRWRKGRRLIPAQHRTTTAPQPSIGWETFSWTESSTNSLERVRVHCLGLGEEENNKSRRRPRRPLRFALAVQAPPPPPPSPPLLFLFLSGTQGRVIGESYAKGRRTCRSTERPLRTGIVRKRAD